jgi:maleylpyruvate isomerase
VEARDADIEAGATRPPAAIRDDVVDSSDRLAVAVREMPEKAWSAQVRNVQGTAIPATDIPWIRARELWVHAVDLDVGAAFTDLPAPMVRELLDDVTPTLAAGDGCPPLRLVARDQDATWSLGDGADPVHVSGAAPALAAWLLGRSRGRDLRTADGRPFPPLPRWL